MERVRPMEKPKQPYPTEKQGGEQPLFFGEIIARAARTLLSLSRVSQQEKHHQSGRDAY
jgi:hypothetical protein